MANAGDVTPTHVGWELLAEGEWAAAGAAFTEALSVEETPEALEGLSWAAWWMDDAETVFGARERAYLLYRQRRDHVGAARMATWLGADEFDFRGAISVAAGWLRRARRLLETAEPGPDHGWLAFHEGFVALHSNDTTRAARLAKEAAELGRRFDVADLEMLGLALQGSILVSSARVEEGMGYLEEATATAMAGEATIPISGAWACCFLVDSCTTVFDYERAFEWCDRIQEFADRYGSRYMLAFCRAEYGDVHLWRGQWSEAEAMLEASVEDFTESRPSMMSGPLVSLAELRRRQGRDDEAASLLDRAGLSTSEQLCRARIALDRGEPRHAADLVDRLIRQMHPERKLDRLRALDLLVRAWVAAGELEQARDALDSLREIEALVATEPLRASTEHLQGMLEAANGNHEQARTLLEDAVDRFQRIGAPFESGQARIELATTLLALDRVELAHEELTAARDLLLELGAEAEAQRALRLLNAAGQDRSAAQPVTSREGEVMGLLAEGLTNRQIAERLMVSEHTVHRHVTNILRKLDLPSRSAAAVYAVREGMVELK
jgi:LuxR family transcriptional regulator, maltose regulon positive regulatory protein